MTSLKHSIRERVMPPPDENAWSNAAHKVYDLMKWNVTLTLREVTWAILHP